MKSKTNIFLIISFLLAAGFTGWLVYLGTHEVGNISAEKKDGDFEICHDKVVQFYNYKTSYKGGKSAIKAEIFQQLQELDFENPGLITFRFVVNCNGKIGRFRHRATDLDIQPGSFQKENITKIEAQIKTLSNWKPGEDKGKTYDSYYVLNFKVQDGKITDIF